MSTPIQSLNLTRRATNCLLAEGMTTVEQVARLIHEHGTNGLLRIPNLGSKWALEVMAAVFAEYQSTERSNSDDENNERPIALPVDLRDFFAAKAMQSLLTTIDEFPDEHWRTGVAMDAYAMAEAMLAARKADTQQ